jgi:UDP-GlcNAc:undecaprenyl-phosphate/decaprenyl-phosphate GlcNAc-1-phosphate transferase
MDGINGISVFYALAVLGGVWLFSDRIPEIETSLMYVILIALVIFGWFNARPRAVAFAGDAGSLSLGLILAWPVTLLVLESGRWEFILLLGVYGVDTVLTIVHRLIRRENIFEAHRSHLYPYLANEAGWGHLPVAILYATTQAAITLGLYTLNPDHWPPYSITILTSLAIIYILVKKVILNRIGEG